MTNNLNNLPTYQLVIDDSTGDGINKISLVEKPAVESSFIAFSESEEVIYAKDSLKHRITGVLLLADVPIRRVNSFLGEHAVVFKRETIEKIQEKFMKDKLVDQINLQHKTDVNGVYLIEIFIKDSEKGINPIEFSNVPDGSLLITLKVDNDELWDEIINGNTISGFSLEGYFNYEKMEFSSLEENSKKEIETIEELLEFLVKNK